MFTTQLPTDRIEWMDSLKGIGIVLGDCCKTPDLSPFKYVTGIFSVGNVRMQFENRKATPF